MSVIAEQIYPIRIPHTIRRDILCTFMEIKSTNPIARSEPAKAAATIPKELIVIPLPRR